ncbi:hypothetical protein C3B51_08405 [Pseudoalteromonas rubra]|uniref:Uncharacterized protein n=1 Tax=Pseudoalteromonas rubra TaxID=43658 RepID=A0A4Q7EI45_9GAMM|nr:hypothetical protein [Pseudoalteromonas rubra]RZM81459.1 hypothetical protein C3B51_08405 [Pseudoalteromonas rubra]
MSGKSLPERAPSSAFKLAFIVIDVPEQAHQGRSGHRLSAWMPQYRSTDKEGAKNVQTTFS